MAKYLLLKHYRGAPAAVNDVAMEQWTPERGGPGISSRSGRRRLVVGVIRMASMQSTYKRMSGG